MKNAAMLVIGNEILSGRTKDTNLNYLAGYLSDKGIRLQEARFVEDEHSAIIEALLALKAKHDYVFTSGGIGPTHDDITADAVATAFGQSIAVREDALLCLENYYGKEHVTDARIRMARVPEKAVLIENPISGAPGFSVENVFVLAGVPKIQQAMLESIRHLLEGGDPFISYCLTIDALESQIADFLQKTQEKFSQLTLGSYPFSRDGRFGVRIVFRGTDKAMLQQALEALKQILPYPYQES